MWGFNLPGGAGGGGDAQEKQCDGVGRAGERGLGAWRPGVGHGRQDGTRGVELPESGRVTRSLDQGVRVLITSIHPSGPPP